VLRVIIPKEQYLSDEEAEQLGGGGFDRGFGNIRSYNVNGDKRGWGYNVEEVRVVVN